MTPDTLQKRIDGLLVTIHRQRTPKPKIIDCTGAREQLLARLERLENEQDQDTSEHYAEVCARLQDALQQSVESIEQRCNIRFVSENRV